MSYENRLRAMELAVEAGHGSSPIHLAQEILTFLEGAKDATPEEKPRTQVYAELREEAPIAVPAEKSTRGEELIAAAGLTTDHQVAVMISNKLGAYIADQVPHSAITRPEAVVLMRILKRALSA